MRFESRRYDTKAVVSHNIDTLSHNVNCAGQAGSVWVRFLPSGYIAPHRVAYDLTGRQREVLHILSEKPSFPLREIRATMDNPLRTDG